MCFSPEASFTAGALLLPAGIYCEQAALRKNPRFALLGLVPIAFGLQQITEGFVWLGLKNGDMELVQRWSVIYLLFAVAFWPIWIPLCLAIAERRPKHRWALGLLAVAGLGWLWLYSPLAIDPAKWLSTEVQHHSIHYEVGDLPGFMLAPRFLWRAGYLAIIVASLALGELDPGGNRWSSAITGIIVAVLFGISYGVYWYAFLSVWCFFAAFLSLLLCRAFWNLPRADSATRELPPAMAK